MTQHDPQKYLYDILSGCEFILEFTTSRTVEDYKQDRAFRSALERELEIIGEALRQMNIHYPEISSQIAEYRNIIGFRHILAHGYDSLDPATVWSVVESKLDPLLQQIRHLLKEIK